MSRIIYNQHATPDDIAEFIHQSARQNNGNVNLQQSYDEMRKNPNYKIGFTKFEKLAQEIMTQNNYKKAVPNKSAPVQRMPIPKPTSGNLSRSSSKSDMSSPANFDSSDFDPSTPRYTFDDVGGLEIQKQQIEEIILLPLLHPHLFKSAGALPTRGLLISGPPGCGKSLLAEATAGQFAQYGLNFFRIPATDLLKSSSGFSGSTNDRVKALFKAATTLSPSLVIIDDIDDISKGTESSPARSTLANCLDQITSDMEHYVAVIATSSKIDKVNSIFRRPGRLGKEISIGLPDHDQRLSVLRVAASRLNLDDDVDYEMIAREADGFVGVDIVSLTQEASLTAVKRVLNSNPENLNEIEVTVTNDDFLQSIRCVQPTLRREGFVTLPPASFEDIGGLENVKQELRMAIINPIIRPDVFQMYGHRPSSGVILYGPPGCGKTLLARAIAYEANRAAFISVKGPELLNKFLGESESAVRSVFRRARDSAPCVIFFDEIDSICPRRSDDSSNAAASRVVNQILTEMDGVADRGRVFVIGATNRLELIDDAMLRPGRLDKKIEVPLPDKAGRIQILERHISRFPNHEDIDVEGIADKAVNFSGAELDALTSEAIEAAIAESKDDQWVPVRNEHYEEALIKMLQIRESLEMSKNRKLLKMK